MHRVPAFVIACAGLLVLGQTGFAQETPRQGVNFRRDIVPIFAKYCLECHGENRSRGGLQLHSRDGAEFGGDTMLPILGGTLKTNEIYLRVSSEDMTSRMPKRGEPLSAKEIDTIRRWVEAGTPWVDPDPVVQDMADRESESKLLTQFWNTIDWLDSLTGAHPYRYLWLVTTLGVQLLILVIERVKKRSLSQEREPGRFVSWARRVRWEHYTITWMVLLVAFVVPVYHSLLLQAEETISHVQARVTTLNSELSEFTGTIATSVLYGDPPIPHRPNHPAALSQIYYRGNCERHERLFNNGNYCTAEMHISLQDTDGRLVKVNDPVPDNGFVIHFELHRSPGTTPALYTEAVINSVFLTQKYYKTGEAPPEGTPDIVHLSTLKANWKWSADFLITPLEDNAELDGLIYVNKGRVTPQRVSASPHYGIRYELSTKDGRLSPDSEIWMGCLFQTPPVAQNQPDKIPFNQWFDHNPQPVITGTNTTDPELLGIPEHLKENAASDSEKDAPSNAKTDSDQ